MVGKIKPLHAVGAGATGYLAVAITRENVRDRWSDLRGIVSGGYVGTEPRGILYRPLRSRGDLLVVVRSQLTYTVRPLLQGLDTGLVYFACTIRACSM
jgi:hypothetical protein